MKKTLLDVIFASGKRKSVLMFLHEGPKEMAALLKLLGTSRQSLLPQMKVLEKYHLVIHYDDIYELTDIGKIIVGDMVPLVKKTEVLETDIGYWGSRDLDFIPSFLLEKMDHLQHCEIINPSLTELFSIHKSLNPEYRVSPVIHVVTTILYPDFKSTAEELIANNVDFQYIVSQELLEKIRTEYKEEFAKFIKHDSFHMYVYNKKMKFVYFTFDSVHCLITMLKDSGEFDHKFMLCKDKSAVDWTKELFDHYLKDSTPVTEL